MPKVLVVDDEQSVRDVLEIFLKKKGFEVMVCSSGSSALGVISNDNSIDLMILDNRMPGIKGFEVLEEMQRKESKLPVILLTGSVGMNENIPATKAVLRKPIDLNVLLEAINKALGS
ncbi:MAG: response regulator [Candidatus Omnitrophota bacterium]